MHSVTSMSSSPSAEVPRESAYRHDIARARVIADRLRWCGRGVIAFGIVVSIWAAFVLLTREDQTDDALEVLMLTGLTAIVSGIGLFATSYGLNLAASRFELTLDPFSEPRQ